MDNNSLGNNKKLEEIIKLRMSYRIPLLILLTHYDTYCEKIRRTENEWQDICKEHKNINDQNLLNYIIKQIEKIGQGGINYKENNIIHTVLIEPKKISNEEALKKLNKNKRYKEKYERENDPEKKNEILEDYKSIIESEENEVYNFFIEENLNILSPKELVEKIKENLPSQYHGALNQNL